MMKITVDMPDSTFRRLEVRVAERGCSISELILQVLEMKLRPPSGKSLKRIKLPIVRSKRPGTLRLTNEQNYGVLSFP